MTYSKNRYGTSPKMAFPHLAYVGTSDIAFLRPKCASKDGTFERENCAPKRPARLPASISHPRYLRQLEAITRPFLTAARLYIPAVLGWSRIGRYYGQNKKQKIPVLKGRDYKTTRKIYAKNSESQTPATQTQGIQRPASTAK